MFLFHTTDHPINTVLSYTNWKNWLRDVTDFRDANDFFSFFFAVSVIVFGTLMFVAGSLVSGAFAGLHFMLWSKKQERRLSELEAWQEQMIVQPPLPLAPMVGEGPGDQDLGYQSVEEYIIAKPLGVLVDILPERTTTSHIKDAGQFVKQQNWGKFQSRQFQSALFLM